MNNVLCIALSHSREERLPHPPLCKGSGAAAAVSGCWKNIMWIIITASQSRLTFLIGITLLMFCG